MNTNERTGIGIWGDFRKLKAEKQVALLLDAMEYMRKNGECPIITDSIAYAMGYAEKEFGLYTKVNSKLEHGL